MPTVACHSILPALRSTATNAPHSGALQGSPIGDSEGGAALGSEIVQGRGFETRLLRDQPNDVRDARRVGVNDLSLRVEGCATPVNARQSGEDERSLGEERAPLSVAFPWRTPLLSGVLGPGAGSYSPAP